MIIIRIGFFIKNMSRNDKNNFNKIWLLLTKIFMWQKMAKFPLQQMAKYGNITMQTKKEANYEK